MLLNQLALSDIEVPGILLTNDGDVVLVTSTKGRGWVENPTASRIEGEDAYQTASKKLAWLNGVKGRHEGTLNPVTGEGTIKLYGKT